MDERRDAGGDTGALVGAILAGMFGLGVGAMGRRGAHGGRGRAHPRRWDRCRAADHRIQRRVAPDHPDARPTAEGADAGASRSMFRSPGHRLVVVLEVVALVGGGALLAATGHAEYTIAWYAGVVGLHFLVFGRLYWAGFYLVGGALVATGVAGAIAGLLGGSPSAVKATSGLGPRQSCSRPAAGPCSRHGPAAARDPGRPRRSQTRSVRGGAVRAMTCPASDAAPAREQRLRARTRRALSTSSLRSG